MLKSRLGSMLLENGLVSKNDFETIEKNSSYHAAAFAKGVVALGIVDDEELAAIIAETTPFKRAPRDLVATAQSNALETLDVQLMSRFEAVPLSLEGNHLSIAVADPMDKVTLRQLEFFTGLKIRPVIASLSQIRRALARIVKGFVPRETPFELFLQQYNSSQERPAYARAAEEEQQAQQAEEAKWAKEASEKLQTMDFDSARSDEGEYEDLSLEDDSLTGFVDAAMSSDVNTSKLTKIDGDDAAVQTAVAPAATVPANEEEIDAFDIDAQAAAQTTDASANLNIAIEETPASSADVNIPMEIDESFDGFDAGVNTAPLAPPAAIPSTPEKPVAAAPAPAPAETEVAPPAPTVIEDVRSKATTETPAKPKFHRATAVFNSAIMQFSLANGREPLVTLLHKTLSPMLSDAKVLRTAPNKESICSWADKVLDATGGDEKAGGFDTSSFIDDKIVSLSGHEPFTHALKIKIQDTDLMLVFASDEDTEHPLFASGLARVLKAFGRRL